MNKVCSKCGLPGEFRKGHSQCRACEKAYNREYYAQHRSYFSSYRSEFRCKYQVQNVENLRRLRLERYAVVDKLKGFPCADCGRSFPPYVMDFDHLDKSVKLGNISTLIKKARWEDVLQELAKCKVVCVCCHRLRTWTPSDRISLKRKLLRTLKSVPCADCGGSFHYCQMDFDHVRGEKLAEVSQLTGCSVTTLLEEVSKCDVVCANCHRKRTQAKPKGNRRVDESSVNMVWKRRSSKTPQTRLFSSSQESP